MKKFRAVVISLLLLCINATSVFAGTLITKEYEFTTTDKNYSYNYEKLIKEDGRNYKAKGVEYKEISKAKPLEVKKTFKNLNEKQVPKTYKSKDGDILKLKDVKYTTARRTAAVGSRTYKGYIKKPDMPETKKITAILNNGNTVTTTGVLTNVTKSNGEYTKPFSVTAKFTGDEDVESYRLGNIYIPNNPKSPRFVGYENVLLKNLGLDSNKYKITAGEWTTDYLIEDGKTVRYAEFTGVERTSNWTAYYEENLTADSPQLATYNANAIYSKGATEYTVKAVVEYEKYGWTFLQIVLITGIGILAIMMLCIIILLILKKKKVKGEKENE